jgi:uncharacterized protein YcbK (DUF882 family)
MWGKIAALVLALVIGLGAGLEATAQTTRPAKPVKPAQKSATTKVAGQPTPGARVGAKAGNSKKTVNPRRITRPAKATAQRPASARTQAAKPAKPRTKQQTVTARGVRPAKTGQMRASGRVVRPSPRGQSRSATHRQAAYQQAYAVPDKRRGGGHGRATAVPVPNAPGRSSPKGGGGVRTLTLYNVHTGQSLTATYWRGGRYVPSELKRLNYFLRDSRDGDLVRMDPSLFDLLWQVRRHLRSTATWRVLSAYRSPETNAWLASFSSGVASNSLHMRGQAIDVMLPDRSPDQVRRVARALRRGGVGYYPSSGFVHLDTGPVRYW